MGRLGPKERRFLAEILYGFITRDYCRTAEVHFDAGYVPRHHSVEDFAQAIRAIGEPIHNRTAEDISMAKLLMLLFEVTGLFDMHTRPELILLQKTMVVVEGVGARSIRSSICGRPPIRWCANGSSATSGRSAIEDAAESAGAIVQFIGELPGLLARAGTARAHRHHHANGHVLSPERSMPSRAQAETRDGRLRAFGRSRRSCSGSRGHWLSSSASRCLDRGDVDLSHLHHRFERAPCLFATGRHRFHQDAWRDLP